MTASHPDRRLIELRFDARPEELKQVRAVVRGATNEYGFEAEAANDCVAAVDEACQNIIRHAYGGSGGEVILEIRQVGDRVIFQLRDFAQTVDHQTIKPRSLDDLRPGGLGTHFMREMMDEVVYLAPPEGHGNLLKMVKRIK